MRRVGFIIQQRTVGDRDPAAVGVNGKCTADCLRLDRIGQRIGGIEDFVGVPFDHVVVVGGGRWRVVPLAAAAIQSRRILYTAEIIWLCSVPILVAGAILATRFSPQPELVCIRSARQPAPGPFDSLVGRTEPDAARQRLRQILDDLVLRRGPDGDQLAVDSCKRSAFSCRFRGRPIRQ